MTVLRVWIVTVFFLAAGSLLKAQEITTQETNPPWLKWYQINTPNFRILYPTEFESQAQRVANTLEQIREPEAASMGVKPKKISILLQNQSAVSNGFVALAPRRSEFFTMPPQDYNLLGTNDWLGMLASHEYRHIVQYQRSITGFNKIFYFLLGQQALAGIASAAAPLWFWEGDAVATETAFTRSGRGRIPNFNLVMRTNLLEGRTYNYHKQYLRSYKNFIPNYYVLGYDMVSYLRNKTGDKDVWEKIAKRAWSYPFIPLTFSVATKKEAGVYVGKLYKEMAASLTESWRKELQGLPITSFEPVNVRSGEAYTDYMFPQPLEDGSVIVQKSGIGDIEQLVLLKDQKEKKKYVQGPINASGMLSGAKSKIVWNEYRYDPRWLMRTYSVIKGYDISTGKATLVSTNSRYAAAAISPDGKRVATVETGTDYQTKLVILDYETGHVIQEFSNPENNFISMPRWSPDGKSLVAIKSPKTGKTISVFNIGTGNATDLIPVSDENIGYPVYAGKYILYNSPYSGIDNIYGLDIETGKRYQVTCSKYGAYNPALSPDGKVIFYNDQARNGMDVVKIPFNPDVWRPIEEVPAATANLVQPLVDQEGHPDLLNNVPTRNYPSRRYRRASGMINPHSWGTYFTNSFTQARAGIYSQDLLSTTSIYAGYQYDINERTGSLQAGLSYQGFYPILDFQTNYGRREEKTSVSDRNVALSWWEQGTTAGLRIPLTLTRSKYYSQFEFGNTVGLTRVFQFQNTVTTGGTIVSDGSERYVPVDVHIDNEVRHLGYLLNDRVNDGNLISNYFHASFTHFLKQSRRDFNPKFGQYFNFEHYSTPYGGDFNGRLLVASGLIFFPGLFKHHSLYFRGGYQATPSDFDFYNYSFRNRLFKPRGYSYPNDHTFSSFSANYQFPVWYPDIALGPVLNIQRVKANLFCDYGNGTVTNYFFNITDPSSYAYYSVTSGYLSKGIEVTFDLNIMRLLQQIELGFRISHLDSNYYNKGGVVYEFLIGNIPF